jgi:hypothetical protein
MTLTALQKAVFRTWEGWGGGRRKFYSIIGFSSKAYGILYEFLTEGKNLKINIYSEAS